MVSFHDNMLGKEEQEPFFFRFHIREGLLKERLKPKDGVCAVG